MPPGFAYLSWAERTDIGRKRKNNEDSVLSMPEYGVFCVADGMGGAEAGEVASGMVVDILKKTLAGAADAAKQAVPAKSKLVRGAFQEASRGIWRHAADTGMKGCGTTAVAIVFDPERQRRSMVLHVGDSRAYRFREGALHQLTTDHSFAAATGVSDERMLPARFRSIITRAVGIAEQVLVDETPVEAAESDIYILCSDGLSRMVPDEDIAKILRDHKDDPPAKLTELLVSAANEAGGHDNVTVVVVKLGALEKGDESADALADATASGLATASADGDGEITQTHTLGMSGPFVRRGWTRRGKIVAGIIVLLLFVGILIALDWYAREHGMGGFRLPSLRSGEKQESELDAEPPSGPKTDPARPAADGQPGTAGQGKQDAAPGREPAEDSQWEGPADE